MNELVMQNSKGNDVTTSLIVAQVFGKEHSKVCRDIENLSCSENFNTANFGVISYIDPRGREQKAYEMTKDGFSFLVMGYTGEKAGQFKEKFITEFNKRELLLKDEDYILLRSQEILNNRVKMIESKLENATRQLEEQKPKVLFATAVETSQKSCLIGELAKILRQNSIDIGEKRLFFWLRQNGYLCAHGERYNQPTQRAMELGLFELKKTTITKPSGDILVSTTTKVTGKGQIYFVGKFLKKEVVP